MFAPFPAEKSVSDIAMRKHEPIINLTNNSKV